MGRSETFLKQHADIVKIVGEINRLLNPQALAVDANTMRGHLSQFAGRLQIHLAMEDEGLYPNLINSRNPNIKATAQRFMTEMGGIKKLYMAYMTKWSTAQAIQAQPDVFVTETKSLFSALGDRINKENNELYPLLDTV